MGRSNRKCKEATQHLEVIIIAGPIPRVSDLTGLEQSLSIYISDKFLDAPAIVKTRMEKNDC